jgi:hypothetical protein
LNADDRNGVPAEIRCANASDRELFDLMLNGDNNEIAVNQIIMKV